MSSAIEKAVDPANIVFEWLIAGESEHTILAKMALNYPDLKPEKLLVAVVKRLEKAGEIEAPVIRGWCVEASRHVYEIAIRNGDLAVALRAINQMYRLAA